ncbi:MAG: UDP-N-acetylmuramate dehydrogenase [Treponema sp.]|jgi:UDP-N-acetylmuramate dehydrogenase|nr:UDP-N-acetylmuramate dehydrogenase [Treponema sp.]
MDTLREKPEKINIPKPPAGLIRFDEPMALHTTFKAGGPADIWVRPEGDYFPAYAADLIGFARSEGIPVFVLGGGANLVVADRGIRGIVLDTGGWTGWETLTGETREAAVCVCSGTAVDALIVALTERGWAGPEFLAGMPGTVGGAVWMNARCQEKSVSDLLIETEIIDMENDSLDPFWVSGKDGDFSYKRSPFQDRKVLITAARFSLKRGEPEELRRAAAALRRDREVKGHFRAPSAGSAFKNNRAFGKPTGKIIDETGLRGFSVGGAMIAPWHGNFIINTGQARAADIRALTEAVMEKVHAALGLTLEPEILFVGDWGEGG